MTFAERGFAPDSGLTWMLPRRIGDVRARRMLLHAGTVAGLDGHLRDEAFALELSSRSEDFREGFAAFRQKRRPRFRGR